MTLRGTDEGFYWNCLCGVWAASDYLRCAIPPAFGCAEVMSLLIKHPLQLYGQTFRINRGFPQVVRSMDGKYRTIYTNEDKNGRIHPWWESADCRKADCQHYQFGWVTTVNTSTDLGKRQAEYIRKRSGREFREEAGAESLVHFRFSPGQKCFQDHKVPVQRDPVFLIGGQKRVDYDEFQTTMNETIFQLKQKRREV